MRPVRILVVDSSDLVRAGMSAILMADPGFHVVGHAPDVESALRLLPEVAPDVVTVRGHATDELHSQIAAEWPTTAILAVLSDTNEDYVRRCIRSGVRGVVHIETPLEDIREAIRALARGLCVLEPGAAEELVNWVRQQELRASELLSPREYEVLRLVVDGLTSDAIAKRLGLSVHTVKTYVRRTIDKLGCSTRAEAAAKLGRTLREPLANNAAASERELQPSFS